MKEVQKNQQDIIRLRQHLMRAQAGYNSSQLPSMDTNDTNEITNVSIIKLA